ncbi:hypothetical protein OIU84_013338 [Salix udensis]|uniref:Uncharacterized protein n=1 Tax=Salix udensis TaxID=889485 RepID=A0AAD6NUC6_9ROSI|nr:hypothetical protein OIU84_013338 [Salix udensis]
MSISTWPPERSSPDLQAGQDLTRTRLVGLRDSVPSRLEFFNQITGGYKRTSPVANARNDCKDMIHERAIMILFSELTLYNIDDFHKYNEVQARMNLHFSIKTNMTPAKCTLKVNESLLVAHSFQIDETVCAATGPSPVTFLVTSVLIRADFNPG